MSIGSFKLPGNHVKEQPTDIPYSGKLSWWKIKFREKTFTDACWCMRCAANCVWVWSLIAHVLIENELVKMKMSSYTVETVVRGYHMYKEVGMPPLDNYIASRNAAVKCSYAPRFRFSPGLLD